MDSPSKRPGSITFLLVGLVLLVMVAGILGLVPLTICPACEGYGGPYGGERAWCRRCAARGRVPLLNKWLSKQGEGWEK
jgi:hypothetical protein